MKVNKTQALMLILKDLLEKKEIRKEKYKDLLEIDDTRFHRYMQEMRAFIANFNLDFEVRYNKALDKYVLIKIEDIYE